MRSEFHGLFSEFHSVLGALAYGQAHGAAGVRVEFRSPLYAEPDRGPNWWTYFFESAEMPFGWRFAPSKAEVGQTAPGPPPTNPEVHLNGIVTKYGRYGGFSDVVGGPLAYLYPMTYGVSRPELRRLLSAHIHVRREIAAEAARLVSERFEPGAYVVGVHYRGTDATHKWTGAVSHYRTSHVPYHAYAEEIRHVLSAVGNRASQVFVATDELEFLEFMRQEFGPHVLCLEDAPRAPADGQAIHLDRTFPVSNYQKGKSAIVDCLVLAATSYLVKGRSNLSDASLAFNPQLPYSFLPDVVGSVRLL
jgi:hypothetical protein